MELKSEKAKIYAKQIKLHSVNIEQMTKLYPKNKNKSRKYRTRSGEGKSISGKYSTRFGKDRSRSGERRSISRGRMEGVSTF